MFKRIILEYENPKDTYLIYDFDGQITMSNHLSEHALTRANDGFGTVASIVLCSSQDHLITMDEESRYFIIPVSEINSHSYHRRLNRIKSYGFKIFQKIIGFNCKQIALCYSDSRVISINKTECYRRGFNGMSRMIHKDLGRIVGISTDYRDFVFITKMGRVLRVSKDLVKTRRFRRRSGAWIMDVKPGDEVVSFLAPAPEDNMLVIVDHLGYAKAMDMNIYFRPRVFTDMQGTRFYLRAAGSAKRLISGVAAGHPKDLLAVGLSNGQCLYKYLEDFKHADKHCLGGKIVENAIQTAPVFIKKLFEL